MNISLTPELERFVQAKVDSGMYTSASEVIRESLRLLFNYEDMHNQRIQQFNQAIDLGLQQLNAGEMIPLNKSYEKLKNKIKKNDKEK